MTGFNLPPGCNVSDIPGNSPSDEAAEALASAIYEALQLPDTRETDEIVERLMKLISDVYTDGYARGAADESRARESQRRKLWLCSACGQENTDDDTRCTQCHKPYDDEDMEER